MESKHIKDRVNYFADLCDRALASKATDSGTVPRHRVNIELFAELRSGGLALLLLIFHENHPFYKEFDNSVRSNSPKDIEQARGILNAVKLFLDN